ncbi:MAG: hypothetical protein U0V70_00825 [Terriglobia bacterium]
MRIRVECYSGYKADERPVRFFLGNRALEVKDVLDQWLCPGNSYFRVKGEDGYIYILRHHWGEDLTLWTLEAFRREAS